MQKKLKIYLDTSVINFLFADDAPEFKKVTEVFFNNYLDNYDVFISEIVFDEINKTKNEIKRDKLFHAISSYKIRVYKNMNDEIEDLANIYIERNIIPSKYKDDARHLAYATYFDFDVLLSWNFKHLSNIKIQNLVRSINIELGYLKEIFLTNPMEMLYE
jgi:hypothetical protein